MQLPSATHGDLDSLVQQQLNLVTRVRGTDTPRPSSNYGDLISDLGEYFAHTAMLWARLTEHLSMGPHIEQEAYKAHERSKAQSHMSDLAEIAQMDVNIARLRQISDLSMKFSREVQEVWRPRSSKMEGDSVFTLTSVSAFYATEVPSMPEALSTIGDDDTFQFTSHRRLPDKSQSMSNNLGGDMSSSNDLSKDDELFQSVDMDALRRRGRGSYLCPKGRQCDKGGVDKDGNLVVFEQNSVFAHHCNKHRKPWRCDRPNCPNPPRKRRFARRGGLERHKATVKHT